MRALTNRDDDMVCTTYGVVASSESSHIPFVELWPLTKEQNEGDSAIRRTINSFSETCDLSALWIEMQAKWTRCATKVSYGEDRVSHELFSVAGEEVRANELELEVQFKERADRWERESSIHSAPGAKYLHKDYISIMTKGDAVVPLILKRLKTSKKDWLWALDHIVPEDQNPAKGINNFKDASQAWLAWGEKRYPSM